MASLNINSLIAHIDELIVFINSSKIDILTINETKLDSNIHDNEIHIPGYEVIRKDRSINGRNGGGVCIYLRSNLNYKTRVDLLSDQLEFLSLEITKPRSKPFLVSTWYRPPNSSVEIFNELENIIGKIDAEFQEFYLLGDININMLETATTNCNTILLMNLLDVYGLSQMITEPTRVTPTSRTLIDLCITNTPEKITKSGVVHIGISDHSLVYVTRKAHFERTGARVIETRQFKHFKRDEFLLDLQKKPLNQIESYSDPNEMYGIAGSHY